MPEPKAPYKLTIKLDGAKPEKLAEALTELREKLAEYDQTPSAATTTVTVEGWQESPLRSTMDAFETWLYYHAPGIDCEMGLKRPGVRPETIAMLAREKKQTPMDALLGDGVDSVTLSGAGKSVTLTAETAERASEWSERTRRLHVVPKDETPLEWLEAREQD